MSLFVDRDDDDDGEGDGDEDYDGDENDGHYVDHALIWDEDNDKEDGETGMAGYQCQVCSDLWGKDGQTSQLVRHPSPPTPSSS